MSLVVLLSLLSAESQLVSGYLTSGFFKVFVEKVRSVLREFLLKVLTRDIICGIILLQHRDFGRGLHSGAPNLRYVEFNITSFWELGGYRIRGRKVAKVPIISRKASANLTHRMRKKLPI